jgi:hypothetical protein
MHSASSKAVTINSSAICANCLGPQAAPPLRQHSPRNLFPRAKDRLPTKANGISVLQLTGNVPESLKKSLHKPSVMLV